MKPTELTTSDIVDMIKKRRLNKRDSRIAVTGETGEGKSTIVAKILFRFPEFNPWKHQVYKLEDVLDLLQNYDNGICWDDEAIETSFNLEWQKGGQQELTKTLTKYRSKLNLYFSVLPEFFTLNKNIRDLFFMHIHVPVRGVAVIHMKNKWSLYSKDRWDAQENGKIERSWVAKKMKNPMFKPPFHKLSTFRAYVYYNDLTPSQREIVEEVKNKKRAESEEEKKKPSERPLIQKLYDMLKEGNLNKESLQTICKMEGKKYSSITTALNRMLNDEGEKRTVKNFFQLTEDLKEDETIKQTHSLVPDV